MVTVWDVLGLINGKTLLVATAVAVIVTAYLAKSKP